MRLIRHLMRKIRSSHPATFLEIRVGELGKKRAFGRHESF